METKTETLTNVWDTTTLGIAGCNTMPLTHAVLGIAGNLGTTLRTRVHREVNKPAGRKTLGDRAARTGWARTVHLSDYTYLFCTDGKGGMRWRNGFADYFDKANRTMPLVYDSAAFRDHLGRGERWSSYETYCKAIDLGKPDAVMARDVIGDQQASFRNYERMMSDGYGDITIPVWQMRQSYDTLLSPEENGRRAAQDAILRAYANRGPMVAIGGLLGGPVPVKARAAYLTAIAESLPGLRLWGLGQASGTVVNGLGRRGMLERISVDGSWWIQAAKCEQIALLDNGLLRALTLARTGVQSFLTYTELMALNLRALKAAYDGLWSFPGPSKVPDNLEDADQRAELGKRARNELQLSFLGLVA